MSFKWPSRRDFVQVLYESGLTVTGQVVIAIILGLVFSKSKKSIGVPGARVYVTSIISLLLSNLVKEMLVSNGILPGRAPGTSNDYLQMLYESALTVVGQTLISIAAYLLMSRRRRGLPIPGLRVFLMLTVSLFLANLLVEVAIDNGIIPRNAPF